MSDSDDLANVPGEEVNDDMDDLFGGDDDDVASDHGRQDDGISDRDLESRQGDENHYGNYGGEIDDQDQQHVRDKVIADVKMFRHRTPKTANGNLQSLRIPKFLRINPEEYVPETFEPSEFDMANENLDHPKAVVRWRKNPTTGKMESNANIYRWSDGSTTLAVGEDHYVMQSKPLAPPSNKPYRENQDANYYAAAAHLTSNTMLIVGHVTDQYTVRPTGNVEDEGLERLKEMMKAASARDENNIIGFSTENPELQQKQAEALDKERARADRRRENAQARLEGTMSGRGSRSGALSIGDLEGGGRRGLGGSRKRGAAGATKSKRRRPEYDSDDDLPQGARRQEDYDMEDGFIVDSDDEGSQGPDDDLLDDDEEEEEEAPPPRSKKQKTTEDDEEDAEGEFDGDELQGSRHRRRHIIKDDEEEED